MALRVVIAAMSTSTQAIARILLVEDEPKLQQSLAEGLRLEGWIVASVASGAEAQELLRTQFFDVIVLDWMLPDCDGLELVRQLRAQGNGVPILVTSARGGASNTAIIHQAGATDYLAKPFSFADLLARTRSLLKIAA